MTYREENHRQYMNKGIPSKLLGEKGSCEGREQHFLTFD